jgi:Cd2+/Zn2+-exporting ATPase
MKAETRVDSTSTRLDLPLLLPEALDLRDQCVARVIEFLEGRPGITRVHVVPGEPVRLCLHYDPERLPLARVRELARIAGAQVGSRFRHVVLPFREVGSEDDGRRIEAGLKALRGITAVAVNFAGQVVRVEFDAQLVDQASVDHALRNLIRAPRERPASVSGLSAWYTRNRELAWSLMAGTLLTMGWTVERWGGAQDSVGARLSLVLYIGAYLFGARDNVGHFIGEIRHGRVHFNIDLLMLSAAAGAAALGKWAEGGLLLFLFSLGHALEHYALGRARRAISGLGELTPQSARVRQPDGTEVFTPIERVAPNDLVIVPPAERIPVDGTVLQGQSAVNQAPVTGESLPQAKQPGDQVFAGSVNGEGALVITVTAAIGDRILDRVIQLVAEAETQKAPTQLFTERFERIFVPTVLVAVLLAVAVPPLAGHWFWSDPFYRAMALLVAASPCALALGTPAAVLAGIAQAARNGVLIKGGAHLETLGTVRVLALDKTGTVTVGTPRVTDVLPAAGSDQTRLLETAAAVERRSRHPLAQAIVRAAAERGVNPPEAGDLTSITGRGVRAPLGVDVVDIGRLLLFEEQNVTVPDSVRAAVSALEAQGRSTMIVRRVPPGEAAGPDGWLGVIGLADEPRPGVAAILDRLHRAGIRRTVMLTGDNPGVAMAVARAVGIDDVRAGMLPEDKVRAVQELAAVGPVAMVGDGVNDAPALAHATVGIAMGGAGTAAALETADVALMGDDLGRLPFVIGLSHRTRRIIRQNLLLSLGVIALRWRPPWGESSASALPSRYTKAAPWRSSATRFDYWRIEVRASPSAWPSSQRWSWTGETAVRPYLDRDRVTRSPQPVQAPGHGARPVISACLPHRSMRR